MGQRLLWKGVLIGLTVCAAGAAWHMSAAPPPAPNVSTFAPAEDLVAQFDYYLKRLDADLAQEADYKDVADRVYKDANTIVLIALALGLHDQPNKYKQNAAGLVAASQKLIAAKDYASAKAALEQLKAAAAKPQGDPSTLAWKKMASMPPLMQQVPLVHSRIKRSMRRFERMASSIAGDAATIAVIGQGSIYNADETKKPDEAEKWYQYCIQMRDAAAQLNKAARAKDQKAAEEVLKALAKSCDDCHLVFHPEAIGKEVTEE
ncbi:MAG: cytochrome c [Thermoguttaceae bacterium]|nr:cytochrome c [Thermoguttaceae bacterium]MDW8078884.1 hypothetical protein [Thermoguttaceae bacterium]